MRTLRLTVALLCTILTLLSLSAKGEAAPSDYYDTVQKCYIGYYQRPADPGGLAWWSERLEEVSGNLNSIIEAFAKSDESKALYGEVNNTTISTVVDGIYMGLLSRTASREENDYWSGLFKEGRISAAAIMLIMVNGAQNEDLVTINNKLAAAHLFTRVIDPELDGSNYQVTFEGNGDSLSARNFLASYATPVKSPTQSQTTAYILDKIANPDDEIFKQLTSITVGSDGGTGKSNDGNLILTIPGGAVSSGTTFTIRRFCESGITGAVYDISASNAFQVPIDVCIKYDPSGLPTDINEEDLVMLSGDEFVQPLSEQTVDIVNHVICGKASHLTLHAIGAFRSTGVRISDIPVANGFRFPIGDPRVLSNPVCGADYSTEDVGDDINLLSVGTFSSSNYPKIIINSTSASNKWIVGTAHKQNLYLTSYSNGTVAPYGSYHPGEDWNNFSGADDGRPVHVIADGIVLFAQKQWSVSSTKSDKTISFGNIVVVGHKLSNGMSIASVYGHLKEISPCAVGSRVNKGDIIGSVGTTGNSTGTHLHFELVKGYDPISKTAYLFKIDSQNKIQLPVRTEYKNKEITKEAGWYWPENDMAFIDKNYYNPTEFIRNNQPIAPTYSLKGIIHGMSNSGPALSGAIVSIAGKTSTTGSTGAFSITGLSAGTYVLSISKPGYATYTNSAYYVGFDQAGLSFYLTPTAPTTPTGLVASPVSSSQIDLSWNASTDDVGVAGYRIFRTGGGVLLVKSVEGTSASDTGLTANTQYCYSVSAYDAAGNESSRSASVCATTSGSSTDITPPSIPQDLTTFQMMCGAPTIFLSWTASTDNVGVAGYKIYRDGTYRFSSTSATTSDESVVLSTTYCYTVSAYDAAGNESSPSTPICDTTPETSCGGWTGARQLGTAGDDWGTGVAVDTGGNVYVTGRTPGDLDGNTSAGADDVFLVKYDPTGIKQWTRQLGTAGDDWAYAVAADANGNAYIAGDTTGCLDGNASSGRTDMFLVKYDPAGIKQWTRQLGDITDEGNGVAVDANGNAYVTGSTERSVDGNTSAGGPDIFLVKYDPTGIKQWTRQLGTAAIDLAYAVAVDANGNAYVTGGTTGGLDGNANLGGFDIFLLICDSNGVKQ